MQLHFMKKQEIMITRRLIKDIQRLAVRDSVKDYKAAVKSTDKLAEAVEYFIKLDMDAKQCMGLNARKLIEEKFD